jgi:hypothetical protein
MLGLITSSNFFVPQVNVPGSMASFVAPAAVVSPVPVPVAANGAKTQSIATSAADLTSWLPLLLIAGLLMMVRYR